MGYSGKEIKTGAYKENQRNVQAPLVELNISIHMNLMLFSLCGRCKAYDTFLFFSVCIFDWIHSSVSGSMEIVNAKKSVVVGSWWRVELGADSAVRKVSETWASMWFGVYVRELHV